MANHPWMDGLGKKDGTQVTSGCVRDKQKIKAKKMKNLKTHGKTMVKKD